MNKALASFFLSVLMISATSHADTLKIVNNQNGHAYRLVQIKTTWQEAVSHCAKMGGYLVTITSEEEWGFIFNNILARSDNSVWAGGTDKDVEGDWKWITGEPFAFTNWYPGEPNNENRNEDYLELRRNFAFQWNDLANDAVRNWFICEWGQLSPVSANEAEIKHSPSPARSFTYYLPLFRKSNAYLTGVSLSNSSVSHEADVLITVYDQNGQIILTEYMNIVPDGQEIKILYTDAGREGWSKIVSNQPLTGVCFLLATGSGINNYMADIALSPKTYKQLHVPHIIMDNDWDTYLFIANPNGDKQSVFMDVVAPDGTMVAYAEKDIAAFGYLEFSLASLLKGGVMVGGKVKISAPHGVVAYALYSNIKSGARSFAGISPMEPGSDPE